MALSDSYVKKDISPEDEAWHSKEAALMEEMGITGNTAADAAKLRKSMLSAEEAVCAKQEEMTAIRQHKGRKQDWQEYLDMKARMGRVYMGCDLLRKLRILLPDMKAVDGHVRGTISINSPVVRTYEDGYHWGMDYIGWIYEDWNPEFRIDYVDEDGVPKGSRQGYVDFFLHNIIRKDGTGDFVLKGNGIVQDGTGIPLKILTEEKIKKVFGEPSQGPGRSKYVRQLWRFRHGLKGDFDMSKWF
jgi:hypothetical protein